MPDLDRYFYYQLTLLAFFLAIISNSSQAGLPDYLGSCGDTQLERYRNIAEVQGDVIASSDDKYGISPFLDQWVVVEGVVTLDKTKEYQGFWLQQELQDQPRGRGSSGIFVYHSKAIIKRGQRVRLLARVAEYHKLTELKHVKALKVCATNVSIPEAVSLSLPIRSLVELENLEGMRVTINQQLLVSDLFGRGYGLGNNGQFAISSQLYTQPTEQYSAQDILSKKVRLLDRNLDYLLVDDGHGARFPEFIPFPNDKGFSASNPLRIGDKLTQISALLHSYEGRYILIPELNDSHLSTDGKMQINIDTNSRPEQVIISKYANFVLTSMNIENYFNGNPVSFKDRNIGFPTSRGAKTYSAFLMQTQKLVSTLAAINADVIALIELENDGYGEHSAIADLTRALNKRYEKDQQYQYIKPDQNKLGRDEISVGILYRSNKVRPLGEPKILDSFSSVKYIDAQGRSKALFNDGYNRPVLLQNFSISKKIQSHTQSFYIAVNHFKSKGRPCETEVKNALQGHCNQERTDAALALVDFINKNVEDNTPVLIVGDLNSYSEEDPLLALAKGGYTNLNNVQGIYFGKSPFFSYNYQGYLGNLDHILANSVMLPFVRSIDSWNINSVEDSLLDYQTESNGQHYPSVDHYAEPDAYRSSDHDPLVIGIEF